MLYKFKASLLYLGVLSVDTILVLIHFYCLAKCQAVQLLHGVCWRGNRTFSESEKYWFGNWLFDWLIDRAPHFYVQRCGDVNFLPSKSLRKVVISVVLSSVWIFSFNIFDIRCWDLKWLTNLETPFWMTTEIHQLIFENNHCHCTPGRGPNKAVSCCFRQAYHK